MKTTDLNIAVWLAENHPALVDFFSAYRAEDLCNAMRILTEGGVGEALKRNKWIITPEKPEGIEYYEYKGRFYVQGSGFYADVPLAQHINELDKDATEFVDGEKRSVLLPPCPKCGRPVLLTHVCGSCPMGQEGYKSKYVCPCGYEEFFKETAIEKLKEVGG